MNNKFNGIWIDRKIIAIKELKSLEKMLFALIYELNQKRVCNASNEYLSEITGISIRAVKDILNRLESKKFIRRETIGRKREIFLGAENVLKYNLQGRICGSKDDAENLSTKKVNFGTQIAQYNIDNIDNKDIQKSKYGIEELRKDMNNLFNKNN